MVKVLASGSKGCRFNPGCGSDILPHLPGWPASVVSLKFNVPVSIPYGEVEILKILCAPGVHTAKGPVAAEKYCQANF